MHIFLHSDNQSLLPGSCSVLCFKLGIRRSKETPSGLSTLLLLQRNKLKFMKAKSSNKSRSNPEFSKSKTSPHIKNGSNILIFKDFHILLIRTKTSSSALEFFNYFSHHFTSSSWELASLAFRQFAFHHRSLRLDMVSSFVLRLPSVYVSHRSRVQLFVSFIMSIKTKVSQWNCLK